MDRQAPPPRLEPLRFGELIDAGFRLWRKGFGQLFVVAAIITVPVGILAYLLERGQVLAVSPTGELIVRDTGQYTATLLSVAVLSIGASFLSASAVLVITTRAYIGAVPQWRDAFRVAVGRLFPFVGLSLLMALAIVAGLLALVIPGIIIGLGLTFATVAFWAEGAGPIESMRRSWRLAAGRRWPIFGLWIFTGVAYAVTSFLVAGPLLVALFTNNVDVYLALNNIGNSVISALVSPLASCLFTAAYYDARVRREGFDLQLAASMLDVPDDDVPPLIR